MNIKHLITTAAGNLDKSDSARLDAEVLLSHVLNVDRSYLFAHPEQNISDNEKKLFLKLIDKRIQGTPIAHLTGKKEFWSLQLQVTSDTLIPRPETETLTEAVLAQIPANVAWEIADLGTGSGAIALTIAKERPLCSVTATDLSDKAIDVAKHNAQQLNIHNIRFTTGNWFEPLAGQYFHIIVSNPPYIAENDPHLKQGDVQFEPLSALVADNNGLECIESISRQAAHYLRPEGLLAFEHGHKQGDAVRQTLTNHNYIKVQTLSDLAGLARVTMGKLAD
ncbi:MAG: peptide chain release factor N(5)-glutamine methyltransferase [Gammaproteobacteria bacterium]|nr:peptide chain release factor N(5)-glutamine methyltransferase [Gammaproteobacteria bacterium]